MNREEFATKVQDLINQAYLHDVDNKYYEGPMHEAEKLRYPITLAEFLGWEEGVEYRRGGNILKVEGNHLLDKRPDGKFHNTICSTAELIDLRNATKYELKYYAKVKGWELIENSKVIYWDVDNEEWELMENSKLTHWNVDSEERDVFIGTDSHDSRYQTSLTIKEWNELGITDKNADFVPVEENE